MTKRKVLNTNTDNKVNKLVTVFACGSPETGPCRFGYPDTRHYTQLRFLQGDSIQVPTNLVPRHCASVHLQTFCYRDNLSATYQLCTATPVMLTNFCTMTAKTRAIPSLHRDRFVTKVPGPCPVLSSGNAYLLYCRAVSLKKNRD
jgi:hypothetical protein